MTSSRGQNVSVFQNAGSEKWKPPIATLTDAGGSLPYVFRNNSSGKNSSVIEKTCSQHSFRSSNGAFASSRNTDNGFATGAMCSNTSVAKGVNSSSVLNSVNRELSPVRWCDRKVDGVYLGRSGWVQVQQRSLDDSKGMVVCDNYAFSTLPSRKHSSDIDPNFREGRECSKPYNLFVSSKTRAARENYERPSKFFQEFQSISPPSVTPIISPPPAFKDDGSNIEFPRPLARTPFYSDDSQQLTSESSPCPTTGRRNAMLQLASETSIRSTASSVSALKHGQLRCRSFKTKSLEGDFSDRIWPGRRFNSVEPFSLVGFHSVDNDTRTRGGGASDAFRKNFESPRENMNCDECEKEGVENYDSNEMNNPNGHCFELGRSSKEELKQRNPLKAFRQRNYQRNGRRTSSAYRTRSSSSDSSKSSNSSSSSSSNSSSSNFSGKNAEKLVSSRWSNSKEKQTFEFENSNSRNTKQFHVKRSRSLQLSEKRSPNESILNNSSGKSWDPMPPEYLTFQVANHTRESSLQFPQHVHHVLVTVNGDSIPVGSSRNQSVRSLNRITTSEEEQKKLIVEAEKEARIVSEFLNGTRSRTAARNLLMHRYLNKHEDAGSMEWSENLPPRAEYEPNVLEADERENFWKRNKLNSSNACLRQHPTSLYSKPFTSLFRATGTSTRAGSLISLQNFADQKIKGDAGNKGSGGSCSASSEQCSKGHRSRNRIENADRFPNQTYENSTDNNNKPPLRLFNAKHKPKNEVLDSDPEALKNMLRKAAHLLSGKKTKGTEGGFVESSSSLSSSSSSPPGICQVDFGAKFIKKTKSANTRHLFEELVSGESPKPPPSFRSDSAPGSDDSIATAVDQRSLSLPRSFLSERYRINYYSQRDLLRWKQQQQQYEETVEETTSELLLNSQRSRTAPTTPTRDLRYCKSLQGLSLSQIQYSPGSSHTFLLDESPFSNLRRPFSNQTLTQEEPERSGVNSSEGSTSVIYENSPNMSEKSSETVLQKFKKNFPLKYLKTKGNFKDYKERTRPIDHNQEIENGRVENPCEAISAACRLISGLQALENDDQVPEKALRFAKERDGHKKSLKSEKYDSHDSGIQMGNRGNVDSSESQDTDLQEDIDSPLLVRKREIRRVRNIGRPESEIPNQSLTDELKAEIQWPSKITKHNYGKEMRRTNSDIGRQRIRHLDAKSPDRSLFLASLPLPVRDQSGKTIWELSGPELTAVRSKFKSARWKKLMVSRIEYFSPNKQIKVDYSERLTGTHLRRSLSQPLGLNEFPSMQRSSTTKCFALSEDERHPHGKTSEEECFSDSESSVASLQERKKSFDFKAGNESAILAEAVWDHVAIESCELPFRAGDVIEVLDTQNCDWWWGATAKGRGYFPSAFVRLRVNQEDTVEDCLAAMARGKYASNRLRRGKSVSLLSNDQVRSSVVRELLNTEKDFVKILRDLKDGYVEQCKRRTDMFTSSQITTIFSNLEDLLVFQEKFLKDLAARVDKDFPHKSCIGKVFLTHGEGFRMYSEYCNSHPMAIATLQDLYQRNGYCKFFETCRLKQSLIEIPLDGYLLTPVQRICKYPLQLAELLKYTKPEHPDFKEVEEALETMRGVAMLINERKRKMESLEKLAAWQQRVEGWEGEDLIEISSRLIHQGEVIRITSGVWTSNITLFLFDHQIVYCKKDLLKRNVYIYKGRIFLDDSTVVDIPDGKNQQLGVTVKYGLKICSSLKDKWLLFCCRSSEDKAKWLEVLAEEKKLVAQDREVGLELPPTAKRLAKMAARTKKSPPCKLSGKTKFASNHEEVSFRSCHPSASKTKSSRRVGTWFTFGGVMKNSKTGLRPRTSLHRIT